MITNAVVQNVLEQIQSRKSEKKIIIGIEGYSGSGKSTLLKKLQALDSGILAAHRDDFLIPRKEWRAQFAKAADTSKAMEYLSVDVSEIIAFADLYRSSDQLETFVLRADESAGNNSGEKNIPCSFDFSKKVMVIEGVFLFHPKLFDHIFDYRIVLDSDQEAADERRRKREMARWGDKYFPDTYPDNYFRLFKIAYNDYLKRYTPLERADLVVTV